MSGLHRSNRNSCLLLLILLAPSNGFTPTRHTSTSYTPPLIIQRQSTTTSDETDRPSSDLKALLPKPASRPLKMDKFGRRIYRMEDDTTVRHTKGDIGDDTTVEKIVEGDRSAASADYTTTTASSLSSNLSNLLTDSKQLAGDKSLAAFQIQESSTSSDLKALLPTAKMRFMKLDKFGRRVQRMEDDGTVSYSRMSESEEENGMGGVRGVKYSVEDEFTSDSEVPPQQQQQLQEEENANTTPGPSLSQLIKPPLPTTDLQKDASTKSGIHGADLKALLPTTKMRFMKLDKFGRRVQRMEDDGTVSYSRGGGDEVDGVEGGAMVDLGSNSNDDGGTTPGSGGGNGNNSVNLKDLAGISKRPVFTKLDFKGGSVEDDRRMKLPSSSSSSQASTGQDASSSSSSSGLKELALSSKRPIFTKLDFKGGSVVDERRTKKSSSSTTTDLSSTSTTKSNLKDLLPKRPTFTKLDFKGGNVEDERRTKLPPPSSYATTPNSGSLQTLLPERKFMWKKREHRSSTNDFIGSVGGDFIAKSTTASRGGDELKERRKKAMREEVMASASLGADDDDDDATLDSEEDGSGGSSTPSEPEASYSNLTDLLPQKKFVFRGGKK